MSHLLHSPQLLSAEEKGNLMQDLFGVRPIDTVFLIDATKQLLRNRRVLEFSYIYGYIPHQKLFCLFFLKVLCLSEKERKREREEKREIKWSVG
jgi:hypothetical protein